MVKVLYDRLENLLREERVIILKDDGFGRGIEREYGNLYTEQKLVLWKINQVSEVI